MSYGTNNFDTYVVHQENEAMKVVSHLNDQSIIDIIKQDIMQKYDFSVVLPINNLPMLIEQTFKQTMDMYPESVEDLTDRKNELYSLILKVISENCNIVISIPENVNLYSYTYYIYDFMVCNFKQYMISFFTNYIIKEKNTIYTEMNLGAYKKDKNSASKFGKIVYTNPKMAAITAFLNIVIDNMCAFDIQLQDILNLVYVDQNIANCLAQVISSVEDFYTSQYVSLIQNPYIYQSIISNIRFSIHNYAIN